MGGAPRTEFQLVLRQGNVQPRRLCAAPLSVRGSAVAAAVISRHVLRVRLTAAALRFVLLLLLLAVVTANAVLRALQKEHACVVLRVRASWCFGREVHRRTSSSSPSTTARGRSIE